MSALLGDDLGSRVTEEHCRRAGVDITPSRYVSGPATGISVAVNFDGDRAFISHLPPHTAADRRDTGHWLEVLRAHRPRWCYVHAGPRCRAVHPAGTVAGRPASPSPWRTTTSTDDAEAVISCVREADVFLTNEAELILLTAAASLAQADDGGDRGVPAWW